jgi:hypothetical protein
MCMVPLFLAVVENSAAWLPRISVTQMKWLLVSSVLEYDSVMKVTEQARDYTQRGQGEIASDSIEDFSLHALH